MADQTKRADETRGPVVGAVRNFFEGLVQTSTQSLLIALAVCAACLVGFVTLLNERTVARMNPGYLAASPTDHDVYSTSALLRLKQDRSDRFLLVIIGASITRSNYGSNAEICDQFRARFGLDADVVNLATSRQSLWEHYGLLRELPRNRPVLAIIGTGPSRYTSDRARMQELLDAPRFGVRLPGVDEQAKKMGLTPPTPTGIYAIDNRSFLLMRWQHLLKRWLTHPLKHNETQYRGITEDSDAVDRLNGEVAERIQAGYAPNVGANIAVLDDILEEDEARPDTKVVFVEHSINPAFVDKQLGSALYARHLDTMAQWQQRSVATYLNIARDLALKPDDFADWAHVKSPDVPEKMRAALFDQIAPFVTELEAARGK